METHDRLHLRAGELLRQFGVVRAATVALAAGLSAEDQCVQSMPDASPTKWHLAHSTWFFETVVLQSVSAHGVPPYAAFDAHYAFLFNSYYEALGPRHPRPQRGLLSRPSLQDIHAYRRHVDEAMVAMLRALAGQIPASAAAGGDVHAVLELVELGLHHEQQHQELLLTDILHLFSCNPLLPAYRATAVAPNFNPDAGASTWLSLPGGVMNFGHGDDADPVPDFAFDNETPRHPRLLAPYQLASRLVTCVEYLQFVQDGGYTRPQWWLSEGWATVQLHGWSAPAYWLAPGDPRRPASHWQVFGLDGVQPLEPQQPVAQLSFFEAAAYAEWAGARLPTEFEWEAAFSAPGVTQMMGSVWQWTRSSYEPYPGFRPRSGAVREYNGKFMVGQQVLRGASVATPAGHSRPSYRNFFPPAARWQFAGLRLARDTP